MPYNISVYLDLVRFLAAMVVFLGHAAGAPWTGGFLWRLGPYGDTCVVIFFVLSGFVIAYVSDVKERTWETYAISRIARLWSVVLPALALTFVVDWIGVRVAPELYIGQPWFAGDQPALRYLASLMMLQEVWHLRLVPGINGPFWSLGYEAIYYLLFGIIFFSKHSLKWLAVVFLLALSGPVIALLFPVWYLGYFVYRFCKSTTIPKSFCYILAISGLLLLAASPFIHSLLPPRFKIMGEEILGRYIDALAFSMHLVGAYGLATSLPKLPNRFKSVIAAVAAATFPLYLLHRPLIQFFSYAGPDDPSGWQRRALLLLGTLALVTLATPPIEKLRLILREKLMMLAKKRSTYTQHARISTEVEN